MDDTGTYLYGVLDATSTVDVDTTGVGDAPVRSVAAAGLAALVSTVPLSEFGEEPLRNHLEDFAWLERMARAHHQVVAAAGDVAPVVPVRLATVYRNDARVENLLSERSDIFTRALDQIRDRTEWGVKAYLDPDTGSADEPADEPAASGSSGTAYLLRRRNQQRGREQLRQQAAMLADEVHHRLSDHSVMSHRHRIQDPRLAKSEGTMILNGAYLTDNESSDVLAAAVEQLRDAHPELTLELTGPWVPYSFAQVDADVEHDL